MKSENLKIQDIDSSTGIDENTITKLKSEKIEKFYPKINLSKLFPEVELIGSQKS